MRRCAIAALLCGALNAIGAESATSAPPPLVSIERQGYAFEYPRVLAEQRLFGIAHGVALLAENCRDAAATAQATADAYARWYDEQRLQIEDLKSNLAAFYYGPRAHEASWQHIAAALNLRSKLDLGAERQASACASLPEALRQPRYDLSSLFQLEAALATMAQAVRIEAQAAACATQLPEAERAPLSAAYADWQRNEAATLESAPAQLQHYWTSTATPGKPEDWVEALKQRYAKPPAATCAGLAAVLLTPEASLAYSFAPPPAVQPAAEPEATPTEQVSAVSSSTPGAVQTLAEPAEEVQTSTPIGNLFDFIMKVFDERPYEDAARESGKQPARSQRAHP